MTNRLRAIRLAVCTAWLLPIEMSDALAKQQCSSAIPSLTHGRWWSYRIIDGRKCWYEGKPMLSRSALEWPKSEPEQRGVAAEVKSAAAVKSTNPLDAQASAAKELDTFEARWRARIDNR